MLLRESEIRQKIKNRWLLGKDPDGNEIGVYSRSDMGADYAFFKNKINPLAGVGNVDLTLTGALGNKITLIEVSDGVEIISTDKKFEEIASKYGDYNFNLSEKEKESIFNEITATILMNILNKSYALL